MKIFNFSLINNIVYFDSFLQYIYVVCNTNKATTPKTNTIIAIFRLYYIII